MRRIIFSLLLTMPFLTGCFSYKDVNFQGVENYKLGKMQDGQISLSFDVKLENPNKYNIKIKPTDLEVYLGDKELGIARLDKKLKIKKKSTASYPVVINARLKNMMGAGMGAMMELATKKSADVRIKGPVKGSVYGFTKKMDIDETRAVDLSKFNFSLF